MEENSNSIPKGASWGRENIPASPTALKSTMPKNDETM